MVEATVINHLCFASATNRSPSAILDAAILTRLSCNDWCGTGHIV